MLAEFIALIRQWIDLAIYVWGGQGHLITSEAQIRSMETSPANADRAIALWVKRGRKSVAFDCSGLIIWTLQKMGLISYDTTADGIYDKSVKITKAELRLGDFAFRVDAAGSARHIGIVTRIINGELYITEARGRDYGVIETPINAIAGYWQRFARNPFIDTVRGEEAMLQKGDKGQPVYDLQTAFQRLGYDIGKFKNTLDPAILDGRDSAFGDTMEKCVRLLQSRHGLPQTGVVDAATYGKLAGDLAALPASTGITQTELDTAKNEAGLARLGEASAQSMAALANSKLDELGAAFAVIFKHTPK